MIDNILHSYTDAYHKLPQGVKSFIGSLYGNIPLSIRFGQKYNTQKDIVEQFENSNTQFQLDYIYNKLYETINFSYENIDFYKKRFDEFGVTPRDFKSPDDIYRFPHTEKKHVRQYIDEMFTEKVEKKKQFFTGGSMSEPTKFYLPFYTARAKEKAYINYVFSKIGANINSKKLLLKGREVVNISKNKYVEYEPIENSLIISSNYIGKDDYVSRVFQDIINFNPKFIFGFPSAILEFTKTLQRLNLKLNIQGIILVSENAYPEQIQFLSSFYSNCQILSQYGHTERCTMAYQLGSGNYNFLNSYGVNIIDNNEIISTGLDNFVMPLINYKSNDFIEQPTFLGDTQILTKAKSIQGRLQEFLVTKDKRLVSICTMGAGHFSSIGNINSIQYRQSIVGEVQFLVESSTPQNLTKIKEELETFTSDSINFNVIQVDKIKKTERGKKIMCVQSLDINTLSTKSKID